MKLNLLEAFDRNHHICTPGRNDYWRHDQVTGTSHLQITFVRRPAESGVTYHVQESTDLAAWSDIASYAGSNIVLTSQAMEVSQIGSPNESVTVRDTSGIHGQLARYIRVNVTRP